MRICAYIGLVYYALGQVLDSVEEVEQVPRNQANKNNEHAKSGSEDSGEGNVTSEKAGQSEDNRIFIPLGFAYELPREFYKGSDPEWQSFIKLARDKKQCDFLKSNHASHAILGAFGG